MRIALPWGWLAVLLAACGSGGSGPAGHDGGTSPMDASAPNDAGKPPMDAGSAEAGDSGGDGGAPDGGDASTPDAGQSGTPGTFNVFDHLPQFGIYVSSPPNYTPPPGVSMWANGTVFVTKLGAAQQAAIGADVAARVTYFAQCDNYDRLGSVFLLIEPAGQTPQPTDPRIELVRFITPFSDYTEGALATHVYPDADLSAYANALADSTHDVWVGIAGGSNPYAGDPCTVLDAGADFSAVGFEYSLDLVSTAPRVAGASLTLVAVSNASDTVVPVAGTFVNPAGAATGHVTVIISGHGSGAGGDEYEYTQDTLTLGADAGAPLGSFSTEIDCAPYAAASPDGNPGIFQNNTGSNPRNWCPGAIVPSHTFPATLGAGSTAAFLGITPSQVPAGSYFAASITFTAP